MPVPTIIIFGASGDLTSRKLIPALFRLDSTGLLPEECHVVGMSRTAYHLRAIPRTSRAESFAKHSSSTATTGIRGPGADSPGGCIMCQATPPRPMGEGIDRVS